MKRLLFLLTAATLQATEPVDLFDGKTLEHWSGKAEHWRVEDGTLTGEIQAGQTLKGNEWIFWDGEVHDFDLTVEFRITGGPSANSGIQYRCQQSPDGHASGYQADLDQGAVWLGRIYDEHGRALLVERGARVNIAPDGRRWTDVFAEPKSLASVIKAGDWNTYRITCKGKSIKIEVNGVVTTDIEDDKDASGPIGIQHHGEKGQTYKFRNLRIKELK